MRLPYKVTGKAVILSDPHFYHGNIIKFDKREQFLANDADRAIYDDYHKSGARGGRLSDESIEKMNAYILDSINQEVSDPERDTIIIVGDFLFANSGNQYRRRAEYLIRQIQCKDVRIVWGNHDDPNALCDLFTFCYEQALINVEGQPIVFNHYPMVAWQNSHHGTILCYGHVHGLYSKPTHPHPMARPELWAAIDVGVCTNEYKPYTIPQILERVKPIWDAQKKARAAGNEHHMF